MVAASVWSLLNPAIEQAEEQGVPGWVPAAGGFLLGVAFLLALDSLLPHLHATADEPEGIPSGWERTTLLVSACPVCPSGSPRPGRFPTARPHPASRQPICEESVLTHVYTWQRWKLP